ncbi:MAG: hypothetical protein ACYDEX_12635 [Mobilitalea sp.]
MANNIVAYVGQDSFDIILYVSRILQKLGKRVLIVDNSETGALSESIPQVQGIDVSSGILTYRKVDFTAKVIDEKITDNYDEVLIDFGCYEPGIILSYITRVVYVTTMYDFVIKKVSGINFYDRLKASRSLLIREAMEINIATEDIVEKLDKGVLVKDVSVLYRDDRDYENSLICHCNQIFKFTQISIKLKSYLIGEIRILCPDLTEKHIKTAYTKAKKGE